MKRNYPIKRFLIFFVMFLVLLVVAVTVFYFRSRPVIYNTAVSNAETMMLRFANDAATEVLNGDKVDYESIVRLAYNPDGEIVGVNVDQLMINLLKTEITNEVSRLVSQNEECMVIIPFGTLLGNEYTAGMGPMLKFPMRITSTAYVDFKSEFKNAGINQVLHKIMVVVNIGGTVLMTGTRYSFSVSTEYIAAQTVIVGRVPDAYTEVIEEIGDSTAGNIFDYGYTDFDE